VKYNPPAAPAVRDMLARVLSSETFKRSERARSLLTYIVEREQAGEAERLKGYTIGVDVFGKDQEFDSSTDAVVRVQAGRLRELLAQYYQTEGCADPLRIAIPLGTYIPTYEAAVSATPALSQKAVQLVRTAGSVAAMPALTTGVRSAARSLPTGAVGIREVRLLWGMLALLACLLFVVAYRTAWVAPVLSGNVATAAGTPGQPAETDPTGLEALPTVRIVTTGDGDAVVRVAAFFRAALAGFETINLIGGEYSGSDQPLAADAAGFVFSVAAGGTDGGVLLELQSLGSGKVLINRRLSAPEIAPAKLEGRVSALVTAMAPVNGVIYGYLKQNGLQSALVNCLLLDNAFYLDWTERRHVIAYRCFERLAEMQAKSPLVYASLASLRVSAKVHGYAYPLNPSDEDTLALARRAVQIGPTSPFVYRTMGYLYSQRGNRTEAIHWMRKAYELNAFDLSGAAAYGYALVFSGMYSDGAVVLQRAVDASNVHPSWWDYCLFLAQFMLGDMDKASEATSALSMLKKSHYLAARLVTAHARGGERRADALVTELVASYPQFAADPGTAFRSANYPPDLAAKLIEALRIAGIGGAG
jgi:hypothetical protein